MKKFTVIMMAIVMTLAMTISMTSCGAEPANKGDNEIAKLIDEGWDSVMSSCTEGVYKAVFTKDGSYDSVMHVEAKMSKEQYEAYEDIDFADDDAEDRQMEIITSIADVTVTDITDKVPTQEEMDKYVGKKVKDLENDGFENSGNSSDPDTGVVTFYYDGPEYCVEIGFDKELKLDLDDLSTNDIRDLTIASVRMTALGSNFVD